MYCSTLIMASISSTADEQLNKKQVLHIAFFPWLAFGHMIPFLKLAEFTAQKGHKISFISTPRNIQRLPKIPSNLSHLINFIPLPLPHTNQDHHDQRLPRDAEATIDVPYHIVPHLKKSYDGLQQPLTQFLETTLPDWIIYDFTPHWLPPIASRLEISQAFFSIFPASAFGFMGATDDDPRTHPEDFTVRPDWVHFPTSAAFRLHEARQIFDLLEQNVSGVSDSERFRASVSGSEILLVRTCTEIESEWINLIGELHRKPVVPVGMLPPSEQPVGDDGEKRREISEWLDRQEKESVVYIAFGTEAAPNQRDLTEIALGLELSGLPFLWALRLRHDSPAQLPEGFVERTKDRGLVWTIWAPQSMILGHESVGGFLTHCGWSSIIEGLCYARPLIMLPFLGDQGLNARVFHQDKKVGMEIPRDEDDGSFTMESVANTIKIVMVDEGGRIYRKKAKEVSLIISDMEKQDGYAEKFVECLEKKKTNFYTVT